MANYYYYCCYNHYRPSCFILCFLCFALFLHQSHAIDYWYQVCAPRYCATSSSSSSSTTTTNLTIDYPFYFHGSPTNCGFPGFDITNCSHQSNPPTLNFSGTDFSIKAISYETKTLRVYDSALERSSSGGSSSCFSGLANRTLPLYLGYHNVTKLHLFYDCNTTSRPNDLARHGIACNDGNGRDRSVWPLYENDANFTSALEICEKNVEVAVDESRDHRITDMDDLKGIFLQGFVLNWTVSDCDECRESGGHCGFNRTNLHFRCFCTDRPHSRSCKHNANGNNRSKIILATAITGGAVALILVFVVISTLIWKRKERIKKAYAFSGSISKPDFEGGGTYFGIPVFSYTELKVATENFDSSKELGDGGFGTVYYGKLQDGREVAVKRLYEHNYRRMEQYVNEINILASLRHPNLVTLYGCTSRKSRELLLVYEYIPNGTVAHHLHGDFAHKSPLNWPVRMKIAIETAEALAYLHKSDIIHRDVKTDNILLDNNFCVKVADFGLSRLFPTDVTHVSTAPQGTPGYVDPEYHQCYHLTDKSDVYSFGVVLIELISSMPAVDINRHRYEINLGNLAVNKIQARAFDELIDASLGYNSDSEITRMTTLVAELAFRCLQLEKDMRPPMDEVLETLKEIWGSNDEIEFERKIPFSPETDDVVLLKKKFQSSPNAVTDVWYSSSSASGSVV